MTRRIVQAIRHIGFEDLGRFEAPLREAGYDIEYIDVTECDPSILDPLSADLGVPPRRHNSASISQPAARATSRDGGPSSSHKDQSFRSSDRTTSEWNGRQWTAKMSNVNWPSEASSRTVCHCATGSDNERR